MTDERHAELMRTASTLLAKADEVLQHAKAGLDARRGVGAAAAEPQNLQELLDRERSAFMEIPVEDPESVFTAAQAHHVSPAPNRIASLRLSKGWTVEQLADRVGCGVRMLRDLEAGKYRTRIASLIRLCAALGVSIEETGIFGRYVPRAAESAAGDEQAFDMHASDIPDLIEKWGGLVPFAADARSTVDEAARWARQQAIPVGRWFFVLEGARKRGIPLDPFDLIQLHDDSAGFGQLDPNWPGPASADAA